MLFFTACLLDMLFVLMSTVVLLSAAGFCFSNVMVEEVGYTPRYRFLWYLLTSRLYWLINDIETSALVYITYNYYTSCLLVQYIVAACFTEW